MHELAKFKLCTRCFMSYNSNRNNTVDCEEQNSVANGNIQTRLVIVSDAEKKVFSCVWRLQLSAWFRVWSANV